MTKTRHPFLAALLCFAGVFNLFTTEASGEGLQLVQESVVGFPIDWIRAVIPHMLPGEGHSRLLVVNENYLLGLEWSSQRNEFEQSYFIQGVFRLDHAVVADANGDGINDVLVVEDGERVVRAFDARTGAAMSSFTLNAVARDATAQDLDGVPGDELIVMNDGISSGVSTYKSGVLFWHSPMSSAGVVTAGGEDSAAREIFVSTATEIIGLDAHTGTERRRLPFHCSRLAVGQTDLDESLELACYSNFYSIDLIDVATSTVQWSKPYWDVRSIAMVDAGGDGRQDVSLRTYDFQGIVAVLNGATGQPFSDVRSLAWGGLVAAVKIGCESAIVATEGAGTTFADNLYLLDPMTLATKSIYAFDEYGITAMAVADLDHDGRNELVVHHDGKITTGQVQPFSIGAALRRDTGSGSFRGMAAVQLDNDSALEYVLASVVDYTYMGLLRAFDGATHEPMWTAQTDDGEIPGSVVVADLDRDGRNDVVTATEAVHSGAKGSFVYAFNGATGAPLWRSVNIPGLFGPVLIADMDADGSLEVLALSRTIGIVRLNGANGSVRGFDEFSNATAFAALNFDGDPQLEVLVAMADRMFVLDQSGRIAETPSDSHGAIPVVKVADIDGDGVMEILMVRRKSFSFNDEVRLEVRALEGLSVLWTSEPFPRISNFGQQESIEVADVDNDGRTDVVLASSLTVRIFSVGAPLADRTVPSFAAGAELKADVSSRACCAAVDLHWDVAEADASLPLTYQVFRARPSATDAGELIGTTRRTEFLDSFAGGGSRYRYSVRVIDRAGNAAASPLTVEAAIPSTASCRRRAVRK